MSTVGFVQGIYNVQVARLDSDGYAKGQAANPNSVTGPLLLPPYRVNHPVSIAPFQPTRELATDRGGQRIRGQKDLGVSDFGSLEMVFSDRDLGFDAVISGSTVDTTSVTGWTQGAGDYTQPNLPRVALLLDLGIQSRDTATYGNDQQLTYFVVGTVAPNAPGSSQNGGVNPNPNTYTFTPSVFNKLPNGVTFADMSVGYTNDENILHTVVTNDQIAICTWIADGTATSFTLPFLPLYNTATGSDTNWITLNGAETAVTSVNTSTGVVTISAAGTTGDIWVVMYPTAFVASA